MKNTISRLEELIKNSYKMSEYIIWENSGEDNEVLNKAEDFLILHNAQLSAILDDLQKLSGNTVKLVKGCSLLMKGTDCTTYNINKNCTGCPFSLHPE